MPVAGKAKATFGGHAFDIRALLAVTTPDGTYIATGSGDSLIRLWPLEPGSGSGSIGGSEPAVVLRGHTSCVNGLLQLADGRLLSCGGDSSIRCWDVSSLASSSSTAAASSVTPSPELQFTLTGHTAAVNGMIVLQDGRLATASADRTWRVWSLPEAGSRAAVTAHSVFSGHSGGIAAIAQRACGEVWTAGDDRTLRLWDPSAGAALKIISGLPMAMRALAVLHDDCVASAGLDMKVTIWRGTDVAARLDGHTAPIYGMTVLADGRIATASTDKTVRLWTWDGASTGKCDKTISDSVTLLAVAALDDGRMVAAGGCPAGSSNRAATLWE